MDDLKRLLSYLGPYRKDLAIAWVLVFIETSFELIIPSMMADLIDEGVAAGDAGFMVAKGAQMAFCALLALATGLAYARFAARAAYGWGARIRQAEYSRIQEYAFPNIDKFETSSIVTRLTGDITVMQNAINNGFSDGLVVNFNNGVPPDEIKKQIEKAFTEKFSGQQNAGRIIFSWNPDKESQTTVQAPQTRDYGEKYNALASRSRQQIFTAFRANPNLFGIPTDNNGFSNEEYTESFNLYNKTQVRPIQDQIIKAVGMVLGNPSALSIIPFTLVSDTSKEE